MKAKAAKVNSKIRKPKREYTEANPLIAYKGFRSKKSDAVAALGGDPFPKTVPSKGLFCRDHYFEVNQTYSVDPDIRVCENGFHACKVPKSVEMYYPTYRDYTYAIVHQWGKIKFKEDKHCSQHIKVVKVLSCEEFKELQQIKEITINKKPYCEGFSSKYNFINTIEDAYCSVVSSIVSSTAKNAVIYGSNIVKFKGKLGCKIIANKKVYTIDGKILKEDVQYKITKKGPIAC